MEKKLLNLSQQDKQILLETLDKWIDGCEKTCNGYLDTNLDTLRSAYKGVELGYRNVKEFIEVNS